MGGEVGAVEIVAAIESLQITVRSVGVGLGVVAALATVMLVFADWFHPKL